MRSKKKLNQIVALEIYILSWLEDYSPSIDKLERLFLNPVKAVKALKEMRREINNAIEQRSPYPVSTIEDEDRRFERWDTLLYNGAITRQVYDYSMTSPDLLCILHWNTTNQQFECVCEQLGCKSHR